MISPVSTTTPISDIDPYSDTALIDPWSTSAELQDAGPAVWLSKYKMFALTRYDSALKALQDSASFPSSFGVMMNDLPAGAPTYATTDANQTVERFRGFGVHFLSPDEVTVELPLYPKPLSPSPSK